MPQSITINLQVEKEGQYFVASIDCTKEEQISNTVWEQLTSSDVKECYKEVVLSELMKMNPYCCFFFKHQWVKN